MSIERRLSKLEKDARANTIDRQPGLSEEVMAEARRVAATCGCWQDLAAYLRTLQMGEDDDVISLDEMQRSKAVTDAFARSMFDEVNPSPI